MVSIVCDIFLSEIVRYVPDRMGKVTTETNEKFLSHRRRELILAIVEERGGARVRELSDQFNVSTMTIRRDIDALAASNQVHRVHGGATRIARGHEAGGDVGGVADNIGPDV